MNGIQRITTSNLNNRIRHPIALKNRIQVENYMRASKQHENLYFKNKSSKQNPHSNAHIFTVEYFQLAYFGTKP